MMRTHPVVTTPGVAEHLLDLLGAGSPLAADVLGDLAEERAERAARDGAARARWWWTWQAARAVPHLLWSAVRSGTPEGRVRLLVLLGIPATLTAAALAALWLRPGPVETIVAGYGNADGVVVVSDRVPMRIPVQLLDARGRTVTDSGVRFVLEAGKGVTLAEDGGVQCQRTTGATVRATYAGASTRFTLSCQPIERLWMASSYDLALGRPGARLRVGGYDYEGNPVTRVSAEMRTRDDSIAFVDGDQVIPRRAGRTVLDVRTKTVADRALVTVYEPVPSPDAARPDQPFVVAPVHLAPGATLRWHLAPGTWQLRREPDARGNLPAIRVRGARCVSLDGEPELTFCEVTRAATVELSHPRDAASPVEGRLWVARGDLARE